MPTVADGRGVGVKNRENLSKSSRRESRYSKNLIQELLPEHTRVNVQSNHDREAA